jgi:hypothetical protein
MEHESEDSRSPAEIVTALYSAISGAAEEERDWERVRNLFLPGAMLRFTTVDPDGTEHPRDWTVEEYIKEASEYYRMHGFWEREIASRTEVFGNIAHVFSTYENRRGRDEGPAHGRGINSVQLVRRRDRWWIAGLVFQMENERMRIPPQYVPSGDEG